MLHSIPSTIRNRAYEQKPVSLNLFLIDTRRPGGVISFCVDVYNSTWRETAREQRPRRTSKNKVFLLDNRTVGTRWTKKRSLMLFVRVGAKVEEEQEKDAGA